VRGLRKELVQAKDERDQRQRRLHPHALISGAAWAALKVGRHTLSICMINSWLVRVRSLRLSRHYLKSSPNHDFLN
jgi:hypothetical protein